MVVIIVSHNFMRRKTRLAGFIALLFICILVWLDISAHMRKNGLLKVLSERGTVVLSPSVTEALLRDLNSGDKGRLQQWHSYLYMCAGSDTNLTMQCATLQDAFALYISKEKPGRSNYFNRLVFCLKQEQQTSPLSRRALAAFLGIPDFTSDGPDGQTFQYGYRDYGKDCLASG